MDRSPPADTASADTASLRPGSSAPQVADPPSAACDALETSSSTATTRASRLEKIDELRKQLQHQSFCIDDSPVDDSPVDDSPVDDCPVDDCPVDDSQGKGQRNATHPPTGTLPTGTLPTGTLAEWFAAEPGQGGELVSLWFANQSIADKPDRSFVVVDSEHCFYPPSAAAWGIDPERLIVVRPQTSDALWAIDQALRCSAVGAVWSAVTQLNDRWFRRFQLAVERSGCYAALSRPLRYYGQPSWANLQFIVRPQVPRSPASYGSTEPSPSPQNPLPHSLPRNLPPWKLWRWHIECVRRRKPAGDTPTNFELIADCQRCTLRTAEHAS